LDILFALVLLVTLAGRYLRYLIIRSTQCPNVPCLPNRPAWFWHLCRIGVHNSSTLTSNNANQGLITSGGRATDAKTSCVTAQSNQQFSGRPPTRSQKRVKVAKKGETKKTQKDTFSQILFNWAPRFDAALALRLSHCTQMYSALVASRFPVLVLLESSPIPGREVGEYLCHASQLLVVDPIARFRSTLVQASALLVWSWLFPCFELAHDDPYMYHLISVFKSTPSQIPRIRSASSVSTFPQVSTFQVISTDPDVLVTSKVVSS
jgi:hypothetical protein